MTRAALAWLQTLLARAWRTWRALYLSGSLASQFEQWQEDLLKNAAKAWLANMLTRSWRKWRELFACGDLEAERALMEHAARGWLHSVLARAWRKWYEMFSSGALGTQLDNTQETYLRCAIRHWMQRTL